jgi:glycosyltransferase involved in cell wall biosynthesis
MLTTFYPPWSFGGDAIHVQRLTQALAERGHELTVVHAREAYKAMARRDAEALPVPDGIRVVPIDAGVGGLSPLMTYLTGRPVFTRTHLGRALDSHFDVVHFHNPSLLGGPAVLRMGQGVKLYTIHEQWLVCPTHVLWKYGRRVCDKPHCTLCTLAHRRPPQPWRHTSLLQRSLAEVDALIAPSRSTIRLHAALEPHARIVKSPPFVPDETSHDGPPFDNGRPYFLYVGRLESIKGVDRIVEAFKRRTEDLLIAGTGRLDQRLRHQAADAPNVRFLGWIGAQELGGLYRGALAVIVPTQGYENSPQVVLEALARGVPTVVFHLGALAELAEETDAVLGYSSPQELELVLDRLASDAAWRSSLGRQARASFLAKWTPNIYMAWYFRLIAEIARRRGHRELADLSAALAIDETSARR